MGDIYGSGSRGLSHFVGYLIQQEPTPEPTPAPTTGPTPAPPTPAPPTPAPPVLTCADGLSLSPVPACECPSNPNIANCDDVSAGELCEGDGECGTDNSLNNCDGGNVLYDVYRKQPLLACADGLSLSPVPACECPSNPDIANCDDVSA